MISLLQMTSTSSGFSSSRLVGWLFSSVWLLPFVIPLNVDASTKKVTMKTSEYKLRLSLILHYVKDFVFYYVYFIYLFQLQLASTEWRCWIWRCRWGTRNLQSTRSFFLHVLLWTNATIKGSVLHANFIIPVFPQGHFRHKSSFIIWQLRRRTRWNRDKKQKLLRLTCYNYAPDGKVWGVTTWHIILWCTSKSKSTNLPK